MPQSQSSQGSLARRWDAVRPHLTERQRRVWLGAEARELGPGGAAVVAGAVGVAADTVRRGRAELDDPAPASVGRSRRPGGGRRRAEAHQSGLVGALDALIDPVTRGDPESPLRWTTKSLRTMAAELRAQGYPVSEQVVRRMLRAAGYSLQGNAKTTEGRQHPDRDAQFGYLHAAVLDHQATGDPVVSVDAKKKELVGAYKNSGREWAPSGHPERVSIYDFIDPQLGKVTPYGMYDVTTNTGWVGVGTDHDTAAFAVTTIASWWHAIGQSTYPQASRLLVTADGGGSNGYRTRAWKTELADLAARTGLSITVTHLPPGTSKWNTIEHRLFSHISMNWRVTIPRNRRDLILLGLDTRTPLGGLSVAAIWRRPQPWSRLAEGHPEGLALTTARTVPRWSTGSRQGLFT